MSLHISANVDFAVRAAIHLASSSESPVKGEPIARALNIPPRVLENILAGLRQDGLVLSRRGVHGGYWLSRPASEISVAHVIRAAAGPLVRIRGERLEMVEYGGIAEPLVDVWTALRSTLRDVLSHVSLADIATGQLPAYITRLAAPAEVGALWGVSRTRVRGDQHLTRGFAMG